MQVETGESDEIGREAWWCTQRRRSEQVRHAPENGGIGHHLCPCRDITASRRVIPNSELTRGEGSSGHSGDCGGGRWRKKKAGKGRVGAEEGCPVGIRERTEGGFLCPGRARPQLSCEARAEKERPAISLNAAVGGRVPSLDEARRARFGTIDGSDRAGCPVVEVDDALARDCGDQAHERDAVGDHPPQHVNRFRLSRGTRSHHPSPG